MQESESLSDGTSPLHLVSGLLVRVAHLALVFPVTIQQVVLLAFKSKASRPNGDSPVVTIFLGVELLSTGNERVADIPTGQFYR